MKTQIMGILNVTPDSFSDGNLYRDLPKAVARAEEMIRQGADMIDVGGESTRPGADPVSLQEEMDRVLPVVEKLSAMNTVISVDTSKARLAKEALALGAHIINDISGLQYDPTIADYVADCHAKLITMHMKGVPKTMQNNPFSHDIIGEIEMFFHEQSTLALQRGVKKENIILDPGIGFGKRFEENVEIIKNLKRFKEKGFPILIGVSRKSMIGTITGAGIHDRLAGSLAAAGVAAQHGADIVRVHDVAETVDALKVIEKLW